MSLTKLTGSTVVLGLSLTLIACEGGPREPLTGPSLGSDQGELGSSSASTRAGELRLRCEFRTERVRSKISVDAKNLAAGDYRARVASGGNSASSGPQSTIGDEVEFDFDSDRDDIAAGATAIAGDFIQTAADPDVTAEILDAAGQVVVTVGANCRVRR